jgi:hypothetical protein
MLMSDVVSEPAVQGCLTDPYRWPLFYRYLTASYSQPCEDSYESNPQSSENLPKELTSHL